MKELKEARRGMIAILTVMLASITRRLPRTRKLSYSIITLILAGILLLVAAGGASAAPCPAPGDMTITTSCELNQSWTVPAGQAGYIIGADGIIIDGAGYKITGDRTGATCAGCGAEAPCTVSGIYNDGYDNVVIRNLEVEGFCTGIALKGTQGGDMVRNVTIDNCIIHDNGLDTGNETGTHGIHACWIDVGDGGEPALAITNNEVYDNEGTGSGCGAGGNGVFIVAGGGAKHEKAVISHNILHDNAKAGFWTKAGLDQSEIMYNTAWGNGNGAGITDNTRGGIILKCKASNRNDVSHNDVHDHDTHGYGIFVGGNNNTVEYNNVTNNSEHGISMFRSDGSSGNELYENTVCDNGVYDIYVWSLTAGNHGDENTCDTTDNYDDTGTTGCTYSCETSPPTPFMINGWVNCTDGSPVNDPDVTVTNTNTSDIFITETNASSNYYRISTSSDQVSAGNVLHFVVSNSNSIEFDHTVTSVEIGAGGFTQNATIECGQPGICGDVNGDDKVNIGDVIRLANHVGFPTDPNYYPVDDNLADVNNDNKVNIGDVIRLANHVGFPQDSRYTPICG